MKGFEQHIAPSGIAARDALRQLDQLGRDAILFVVDAKGRIIGSLTDGDVRRGLIQGIPVDGPVNSFLRSDPKVLRKDSYTLAEVIALREGDFKVVPVVDADGRIVNIINFRLQRSYLPVDAVIMAGGRGERLRPLTDTLPKPLLPVGGVPIIEHNINRLRSFGVDDVWVSVNYLGDAIRQHLGDGTGRAMRVNYVQEDRPLGTAGSMALAGPFGHNTVLLMNSDLLTNIDFEDFFLAFEREGADLAVACITHKVNVPYAVMETKGPVVTGLREKPTYAYLANAGMYLLRSEWVQRIPRYTFFNATDLMELVMREGGKVVSYPFTGYWLDIGQHEEYQRAQSDFPHISF